jgi:5,6-dimethylbenzimidazole synthase
LCLGYVNEFGDRPVLERAGWLPRMRLAQVVCYEQWDAYQPPEQWSEFCSSVGKMDAREVREDNI